MRKLFQNRILVPGVPAKVVWQNRDWLEIVGSCFALSGTLVITIILFSIL